MAVERTLHHYPLDPFSRQARLVLGEKKLAFRDVVERYWEMPEGLTDLNPSGLIPVLVEEDEVEPGEEAEGRRVVACESRAVLDFLEEQYPSPALMPADPGDRAEVRRLMQWFDRKFDGEVNTLLLHEKMEKRLLGMGAPDLSVLRQGREILRWHLDYAEGLLQVRDWLAGRRLSLADIVAVSHLSVIDYMGEIPWRYYPALKTWYVKLKSRPSFRTLLTDRLPGVAPSPHYDDLDF